MCVRASSSEYTEHLTTHINLSVKQKMTSSACCNTSNVCPPLGANRHPLQPDQISAVPRKAATSQLAYDSF